MNAKMIHKETRKSCTDRAAAVGKARLGGEECVSWELYFEPQLQIFLSHGYINISR